MIKSIRLVNWKSHLDSVFKFSGGVNVLVGIMGSGKTSIVQALSFALFGTFPSHQSRKVNLDDLIMKRPQKKDRAEVHLEFSVSGKNYMIKRVIQRGKGTVEAEIRENEKILNVNPQGVTEEVKRILQMDYELFSKAIYSEQNNLDYFLKIPRGKRMEHIDRMLNLERFERAREQAMSLINRATQSVRELSQIVNSMERENLEDNAKSIRTEIKKMKDKQSELNHSLESCSLSISKLSASLSRLEEIEEELNEIRRAVKGIESSISEIRRTLDSKRKNVLKIDESAENVLIKMEKDISSLEESLKEKTEEEKKEREQIASMNTRLSLLNKDIDSLKREIRDNSSLPDIKKEAEESLGQNPRMRIEEMERDVKSKKEMLYKLFAEKEGLEKNLAELKKADVNCPVCDSIIEESKKLWLISEREREIKKLEGKIRNLEKSIEKDEGAVMDAKSLIQELEKYEESLKLIEKNKEELKSKEEESAAIRDFVKSLVSKLEKIRSDISSIESNLKNTIAKRDKIKRAIEDANIISELEERMREKTIEMERLLEREKQLSKTLSERDIKTIRTELQEKIAQKRELESEIKNISERIRERLTLLSDIEKRISLLNEYRTRIEINDAVAGKLKLFMSVLKQTQNQLREEFLRTVNMIMDDIWKEIYPYADFESARLAVDGDYILQLKESGRWINVEGIVSGGERSIATLVLRIAFSIAFMPNLRWLILDEPTHNLDSNAIERITQIFKESMHSFAEQIFLITHEERLAEASTGSFYKLERDKNSGSATVIASE